MDGNSLYVGPSLAALESELFETASAVASPRPESVLYLRNQDEPIDRVRDQWQQTPGTHASQLKIATFDDLVNETYECESYRGPTTRMNLANRYRLVEAALTHITDSANPLQTTTCSPGSGLVTQVEDLLSLLEFAGEITPTEIQNRLQDEGLSEVAQHLATVSRHFHDGRTQLWEDRWEQSLRAERYLHVLNTNALTDLTQTFDGVVLGRFTLFSPLEAQLVAAIAESVPTHAGLALPNGASEIELDPDRDQIDGVDVGVQRAVRTYTTLGFTPEFVPDHRSDITADRRTLVQRLYSYQPSETVTDEPVLENTGISWHGYRTRNHEIRGVARAIRSRLADGMHPSEIGVVLTDQTTYQQRVFEQFDAYQIPVAASLTQPLRDTETGTVLTSLLDLAEEPRITPLLQLLSSPLVEHHHVLDAVDLTHLSRIADRHETTDLHTLLTTYGREANRDGQHELESLLTRCQQLSTTSRTALWETIDGILTDFGIVDNTTLDGFGVRTAVEQASYQSAKTALCSLETTAELFTEDTPVVDHARQALELAQVDWESPRTDAHVTVTGFSGALGRDFEHVYVLGLTTSQFPSQRRRLTFTRQINEAHPDFEEANQRLEARYILATLLADTDTVVLSHPQQTTDGSPLVEADFLAEIRRITDTEPTTIDDTRLRAPDDTADHPAPQHAALTAGTREDLYRDTAQVLARQTEPAQTVETVAAGLPSHTAQEDRAHQRLTDGTALAAARAQDQLTPHDGQLPADTIAELYGTDTALSPSAIEDYAGCGFKFYMSRVLDIPEPDEYHLEADHKDRGWFIHEILERYYHDAQTEVGEPVDPTVSREDDLLTAAKAVLDEFEDHGTTFHEGWLRRVFAGLGSPAANPYYETPTNLNEHGLLVEFLTAEAEGATTGQPAWLEPRIGREHEADTTVLSETPISIPGTDVEIQGKIDRIDLIPDTDPTKVVVYDYKTGSTTPGTRDTIDGLRFQLPLYLHMIEVLEGVEGVGGEYYQVSPPSTVSKTGSIGSKDNGEHAYWGDPAPLRYGNSMPFESHRDADEASFQSFIESTVPERLDTIAEGIQNGHFHPTLLAPTKPNCEYCAYRSVCDVRHHRRHDIIETTRQEGPEVYVPPIADAVPEEHGGDE